MLVFLHCKKGQHCANLGKIIGWKNYWLITLTFFPNHKGCHLHESVIIASICCLVHALLLSGLTDILIVKRMTLKKNVLK